MRTATVLTLFLMAGALRAELPAVRLDRIAPLGAAAGSTVELEVIAADAEDARALLFDHPGLKAEHLKDNHFRVRVAADVPEGTYDARLVGRFGVSNPRLFTVSHGLTDVAEKEPNDEPANAQPVAVNSAVNGFSDGNRDDLFRVPLKQGQRVVIECQAGRLESLMQATLTLADADGKPLVTNGGYNGRDPLVDYVAARDGDYLLNVHDLSYRGGQPYRLVITDRPWVENVFPRAVQAGKPTTLTRFGRNLGKGAKPSTWRVNDLPLDEQPETVTAPPDLLSLGSYRFTEHPTAHTTLPTAATCTVTGFQVGGVPVLVTDSAVTLEQEPNDDPRQPQALRLPAVVSGRFDRERDADWYAFETAEPGPYAFDVYCERIAGRADPYLVVLDDKDNRVAELDDYGHRINAFDGHLRDPSGVVNLSGKTRYRVLVQDRYRRGGARYQYVLVVRKPVPDFYAAAIHPTTEPKAVTIGRGGANHLDIVIHRQEGFSGPVTVTAEGLPPGLHAAPTVLAGESQANFVLWADADAPEWNGTIKLFATGKRGDTTLKHEVRPYARVWAANDLNSSRPSRELTLAIRPTAPFGLRFLAERVEVEAGKKAEAKLRVDRIWPDFKGAVTVTRLHLPGPFQVGQVTVPEGQTEAAVHFEVQPGAQPGEYTVTLQGQAQVPFNKDPKATTKPSTLVTEPSRPVTLVVLPPKKEKK